MPTLASLPLLIFSPSADDITIKAEGDVVLTTTITADSTTLFDFSSSYAPGPDGCVHVERLSELVNTAILASFKPSTMLTPGCRSASCELKLTANGESKQVHALYMTRLMTDIKPMFATLLRRRRVVPGSSQPVSILTAGAGGLTLQVGAAYKLDKGGLAWREVTIEVDCSNDYFVFLADIDEVKRVTSAPIGTLLYYTIVLLKDGKQADKISFDIDNKTRPSLATHFVFLNLFGVPESFTFRGKDTEEQELESDFGYANNEYIQLNAQLVESHKANTGWLRPAEKDVVYGLMGSHYLMVYADGTLRRATITEVDSSISRPTNEPANVSITWRYADRRHMQLPVVTPDTGKGAIFAKPPFDKTFD